MTNARVRLGVKWVEWKIVKWEQERKGHEMLIDNRRLTNSLVFRWYWKLEENRNMKHKKK